MNKFNLWIVVACGLVALACGHGAPVAARQPHQQPRYAAVLIVMHMCCAKESVPAIKELSKLPGVKRVSVDYKSRSLMIEQTDVAPSPQAVWDAADRTKIAPVRLTTPEEVYTRRPRR